MFLPSTPKNAAHLLRHIFIYGVLYNSKNHKYFVSNKINALDFLPAKVVKDLTFPLGIHHYRLVDPDAHFWEKNCR